MWEIEEAKKLERQPGVMVVYFRIWRFGALYSGEVTRRLGKAVADNDGGGVR